MERNAELNDTMLFFEQYSADSKSLHTSFKLAGCGYPAVVIEDDGFLPEDVMSVYGFFLGDFKKSRGSAARPRYFNEITVPDYWAVSGTNSNGKIHDKSLERGRIFYAEPLHKRLVKIVDWCDERGVVRSSDHYNRYGAVYARTVFNARGQRVNKSYFSATGQEIIVENYVTGDIILNDNGAVHIFRTKTDFILYFFTRTMFGQSRIFFNSLSTPFFVSQRLGGAGEQNGLFWQEPIGKEIPGNMQIILNGKASRTANIMVQKRQSYYKLLALGAKENLVHKLGFIYPFERENSYRHRALICTNSDQIEQCRKLAEGLPQMQFYIAALTEMSSKLMQMEQYENVVLYPNVTMKMLDALFEKCDYYFDINHGAQIVSAIRRAFLHNQLIFAFQETAHDKDYVADEHIYPAKDVVQMISDIRDIMGDVDSLEWNLKRQHMAAMAETESAYVKL